MTKADDIVIRYDVSVKKVTNFTILIIPVLIEAFFEEEICLRSVNTSHITLIPKKDGPSTAADYRPISLLNTSFKLITKVLANRLQKIIRQIIHKNQYGFIKTRNI